MADSSTTSGKSNDSSSGSRSGQGTHGHGRGHKAARAVRDKESLQVSLPVVGDVELPHPQQLAYLAGIGVLAALEIIEWPAALVLAVGHTLVTQQHNRALEELGEALDEA